MNFDPNRPTSSTIADFKRDIREYAEEARNGGDYGHLLQKTEEALRRLGFLGVCPTEEEEWFKPVAQTFKWKKV